MIAVSSGVYISLAGMVLLVHLFFMGWIVFGAILTRSRPVLKKLHVASLLWGILIEVLPWTCPLTYLENWLERRAGVEPYQGGFLLRYLDRLVYPNISPILLTCAGVVVCVATLTYYSRQAYRNRTRRSVQ